MENNIKGNKVDIFVKKIKKIVGRIKLDPRKKEMIKNKIWKKIAESQTAAEIGRSEIQIQLAVKDGEKYPISVRGKRQRE